MYALIDGGGRRPAPRARRDAHASMLPAQTARRRREGIKFVLMLPLLPLKICGFITTILALGFLTPVFTIGW